jgi:hypothetical protein
MPRPGESVKVSRRKLTAGLAGGRLRRSDAIRIYPATSVRFSKCQNKYCGKDTWVKWGYPSNWEYCGHPVITP